MAQLLVRDIPEETVAALKRRAKENGRSAEAEHRAILEEALHEKRRAFMEDTAKFRDELRARGVWIENTADVIRKDRDSR